MAFLKYFPLVKVDESTHTISGIATAEVPDKDGEICDYDAAKKAYAAWSKEALASTKAAGQELSYGNIRVQHTLEIGGKVSAPVVFDDEARTISLHTEPENDGIFTKARKGFIRGFSQGGDYAWRKCNECRTDIAEGHACPKCEKAVYIRYAPVIAEVSYVDNPCVKAATFTLVKADGSSQIQPFQKEEGSSAMEQQPAGTPATLDVNAIAAQAAKAVLAQLGKSVKHLVAGPDGTPQLPYTDATGTPNCKLMGKAWAALHGKAYAGPVQEKALTQLKAVYAKEGLDTPDVQVQKAAAGALDKAAEKQGLAKGLYDVSHFAELLQSLNYLRLSAIYERDSEEDDSSLPEALLADIERLAETFLAMATEETEELTAIAGGKGHTNKMSNNSALAKASKSIAEHIQKAKDLATAHCDKLCKTHQDHKEALHECFDKMAKCLGGAEAEEKPAAASEGGSGNEPAKIDPKAEGTPSTIKTAAAGETFTKADLEKAASDAANAAVQAVLKALASDEDEEENEGEEPKEKKTAKKAAPAAGIGDRSHVPVILSNAGPAIKTMPVTKAMDSLSTATPAVAGGEPLTPAELQKAISGDREAALKLMKGANPQAGVPATVAGALSSISR